MSKRKYRPKSPKTSRFTLGTFLALLTLILPTFVLIWTGDASVTCWMAVGYLYLTGYYRWDFGWISGEQSALHLFKPAWYLNPHPSNIAEGSQVIDGVLNLLATAIYPGQGTSSVLHLSGLLYGLSMIVLILGLVLALLTNTKLSGLVFMLGALVGLGSMVLIWSNAINLIWFGGLFENNFIPIPVAFLLQLLGGFMNFRRR